MTQMAVKTGGAWKAVQPFVRIAGIWTAIVGAFVRDSGSWVQFFTSFGATASKTSLYKGTTTSSGTTASTTVTPSGGASPYMYSWAKHSGSSGISCDSPTSATTTFTATTLTSEEERDAVFRCTVTDDNGHTVTVDVGVTIQRLT